MGCSEQILFQLASVFCWSHSDNIFEQHFITSSVLFAFITSNSGTPPCPKSSIPKSLHMSGLQAHAAATSLMTCLFKYFSSGHSLPGTVQKSYKCIVMIRSHLVEVLEQHLPLETVLRHTQLKCHVTVYSRVIK